MSNTRSSQLQTASASSAIVFYDRYTRRLEREKVYKEAFLRFVYGNPLGRLALNAFVKRGIFSYLYGIRMDHPASAKLVSAFIREYQIDSDEFLDPPGSFRTFNEFFYRKLKPEARPIAPDSSCIVLPADGRHLAFHDISQSDELFVKNCAYRLSELLGSRDLGRHFEGGSALFSRLAPVDYHRFCFPVSGLASRPQQIEGDLYSVSPIALRRNAEIFLRNRRWVSVIENPAVGTVAMIEVGATNVGKVEYTSSFGEVTRGGEKGYFKFGGSSVVTLFERGRVRFASDIVEYSGRGYEVFAHVGDVAGAV